MPFKKDPKKKREILIAGFPLGKNDLDVKEKKRNDFDLDEYVIQK